MPDIKVIGSALLLLNMRVTSMLMASGLVAMAQTPHFKARVTNIHVQISVTQDGRVIEGLKASDFVVRDEGEIQPVVAFAQESVPIRLILLLDMSGSMRRDIREVAAIAGDVLKQVRAGDQVGVMSFVMRARLECPLTQDIASVVSTIRRVASAGTLGAGTRLIAPISSALHVLADQPGAVPSRDAILIITDNIPAPEWTDLNFEFTPDAVIIRDLLETNSILNAIVVHRQRIGKRGPPPRDNPTAALYTQENVFHIAEATGGDAIISARMRDSFPDMLARIRARYSIWYRPPEAKPGAFRLIRVSLSDGAQQRYPRATIRARTGYYAQ